VEEIKHEIGFQQKEAEFTENTRKLIQLIDEQAGHVQRGKTK
jgi:S-adenosylmethionine synthetase